MSLEADLIVDRLRLKRRLTLWRVLALVAFVAAALAAAGLGRPHPGLFAVGPHLARLRVDGVISSDRERIALIDEARRDASVKGLLLEIDSPGGSVAGGESLHDAIARFAAAKPVAVSMGGLAASAGYMIAVPGTRLFASQSTLTGSIGVILQSPDVSGLLGKVGVGVDELVSGPLKGQPSVVKPLSPEGRAMLQGVVMDLYDQFVGMVAQGRHMDAAKVRALADGRPYTGRQALPLGLIDQIGDTRDAQDWLAKRVGLDPEHPVALLRRKPKRGWLGMRAGEMLGSVLADTVQSAASVLLPDGGVKSLIPQGVVLDGAVSIWQP